MRRYHVYCNAQLIQSQNENFLLAKVLDLQILTTHRLVSFVKDQEEKRSFLLWWAALRLAAGAEDTPVLPTPASQPLKQQAARRARAILFIFLSPL